MLLAVYCLQRPLLFISFQLRVLNAQIHSWEALNFAKPHWPEEVKQYKLFVLSCVGYVGLNSGLGKGF